MALQPPGVEMLSNLINSSTPNEKGANSNLARNNAAAGVSYSGNGIPANLNVMNQQVV